MRARSVESDERTVGRVRAAESPDRLRVAVSGRDVTDRAGVRGVLFSVAPVEGSTGRLPVELEVGYSSFKGAFGGDYAGRLRLVRLPGCVLVTPERPECQRRAPVGSSVNVQTADAVTATVPVVGDSGTAMAAGMAVAPMVLALEAGAAGAGGTYAATSLKPAYSWAAGGQGGSFTYNFPLKVPASLGGPAPSLALSYDSGVTDGQTVVQNGQTSWVGEGWSLDPGFIERSYRPCSQDNNDSSLGDMCWFTGDNATMVFNGRSTRLVRVDGSNVFRSADDDALKVERLNGSPGGMGDNGGVSREYWRVTAQDGIQYYFGAVHRYTGDPVSTESALNQKVVGNNDKDPCYRPNDYVGSACYQTYRWNLDYVVDPRGNTMTYFYNRFTNFYGGFKGSQAWAYDASAVLDRVEYGTRMGTEGSTVAPMKVVFGRAERCRFSCTLNGTDYPDTPWDQFCQGDRGACLRDHTGMSYFTRYRLGSVTTQVLNGSQYRNVDRWDLEHGYPPTLDKIQPAGDDTTPNLWLERITHVGYAADGQTSRAEPSMSFGGYPDENRKNWAGSLGLAPYMHYRMHKINNGVGGETEVLYAGRDCVMTFDPQPAANPNRCFPVNSKPVDNEAGWDWFHKYVVGQVISRDLTGGSPDEVWAYDYVTEGASDAALWHHDYSETVKLEFRSWSLWQGYPTVVTYHGRAGEQRTVSKKSYHRGMDDDAMPDPYPGHDDPAWFTRRAGLTGPLGVVPGAATGISGDAGFCLDVNGGSTGDGAAIQLWDCHGGNAQVWRYDPRTLRLENAASRKCLDITGGGTANGTPVQQYTCNAGPAQVWRRNPDGGLWNPNSGKCLSVAGDGMTRGNLIQIINCDGNAAQVWQPQANGTLLNAQSSRCVDIADAADGGKIQTWRCNGTGPQQWQLRADGNVVNPAWNKCLDIARASTDPGAVIVLWPCASGAPNQVWRPQPDGSLKNPASGLCLDVAQAAATRGRQLQTWTCIPGAINQRWTGWITDATGTQGRAREETSYHNGQVAGSTVHEYGVTKTAARGAAVGGGQEIRAYMVNETATKARTRIDATSSWRWTQTDTRYDAYGLPVDVTSKGDLARSDDDTCTHTDYARDESRWLVNFPSQTLTTNCDPTPGDTDFLAGARTFYDGSDTTGEKPSKGLATKSAVLAGVVSGAKDWKLAGRSEYDAYGRATSVSDALERKTSTAYTPATGGPVTSSTVTNPLGWTTVATVDPGKGLPTKVVDVNGKVTNLEYDPLGRLGKVWLNNRPTSQAPDSEYAYLLRGDGPNAVSTTKLGPQGERITSYELFDGNLRLRQTQTPAPEAVGGRVIADVGYDSRGLKVKSSTFWNNQSAPGNTLVGFTDASVVNQHRLDYDDLARPTVDALYSANSLKWKSSTAYDGDRTTLTPPPGGTPTTTITDARGKTTTLRQYLNGSPTGAAQDTTYTYDRLGRQTSFKDPVGNTWTTKYDLRGRTIETTDPDKGKASSTYDDAGQLTSTTDARDKKLTYSYDGIGRKTDVKQGDTKLTEWTFDTITNNGVVTTVKGEPATATRYADGKEYRSSVVGYDDAYRPLGTTVQIPSAETGLAGAWTTTNTYNVNGSPASTTYPQAGGLATETVNYSYDNVGLPIGLAGADTYIADTDYYYWGAVKQRTLGTAPKQVKIQTGYEEATGRLTQISTSTQAGATTWAEKLTEAYNYNPAGQVTSITETNAGTTVSNQCFTYDGLNQLTEAWTTTAGTCQTTPSADKVGGPDAYWASYRYDPVGNRTKDIQHNPGGDTTRTYTYPAPGAARPHAVKNVTTTGATTGTNTYAYDNAGNTTTRNVAGKPGQTLTWDVEGHLATLTDSTGTASYLYDAGGARLISRDNTGTTLYLGSTEIRRDKAGAVTANRFYADCAVRTTGGGLTWLANDHHATGQLSVNAGDLAATRRKVDPFGNPRGTQAAWPTNHGFVNGVTDPTGLTHLGAREYDPTNGRFISVDPLLDAADPIQMNGYSYANNNPTTSSDPDGLIPSYRCPDGDCPSIPGKVAVGNGPHPAPPKAGRRRRRQKWR